MDGRNLFLAHRHHSTITGCDDLLKLPSGRSSYFGERLLATLSQADPQEA